MVPYRGLSLVRVVTLLITLVAASSWLLDLLRRYLREEV